MVTKDREFLQDAIDEVFDKFARFDFEIVAPNLRYASSEKGTFRVVAMSDDSFITFSFHNTETDGDLGHVQISKANFEIAEEHAVGLATKCIRKSLASMRILIAAGMVDPKFM